MNQLKFAIFLYSSTILRVTTGGSDAACIDSCMKLVRETAMVYTDEQCKKGRETLDGETEYCRSNCQIVSSTLRNKKVSSGFVTNPPVLHSSEYNSITLKWNISAADESRSVAFYILQVQSNMSQRNPLEILPSIPKFIMVNGPNFTNSQTFTVENLVNGLDYRFCVAAVGFDATNSKYSDWSPWYSTSSVCKRTTGLVKFKTFSGEKTQEVNFSCPVSRITLNVSIKATKKQPVVLDATLNWKNPPGIDQLEKVLVRITVKLVKHEDEKINATCAHFHNTDFKEEFIPNRMRSSYHLLSDTTAKQDDQPKKSIHFGCRYSVKFEVIDAPDQNSFETETRFDVPECLQGVSSCPVPKLELFPHDEFINSDAISENIFLNGASSYAANISWNSEKWVNSDDIEFFHIIVKKWPPNSEGGFFYSNDVATTDKLNFYHVVVYNMSEGKRYLASVRAYHGVNCKHDMVEHQKFLIQKPCSQGCTVNATCWPKDLYDGTAVCKCKVGYSGNGTVCKAKVTEAEMVSNEEDTNTVNVLAIVIPLSFVLVVTALIVALISWRIKRKRELVLDAIGAHESAIGWRESATSPSSSNSNFYQNCRSLQSRYEREECLSKGNEVELGEKEVNVIYVPQEIQNAISNGLTDGYEFNAEQIKFEECLGRGAFGYVHRARALGITAEPEWTLVAVKTLSEPVTDKSVEDFIAEIELMKRVGDHENVIQMLGCCTVTSPICLIMEYASRGNLLTYLRTVKSQLLGKDSMKKYPVAGKLQPAENPLIIENGGVKEEFIHDEENSDDFSGDVIANKYQAQDMDESCTYLKSFALQIANGMAYVAGRGIVHRDLAARNILIGSDYKLKISDFGLSKEGVYVKSTSGKIPLRWLSIEAIRERIYSSASDVWSFGIVLWEICTLGDFPYPSLSDRELLKFLVNGERLERPSSCSDEMYHIMLQCWQGAPEDRPTFAHLRDVLWKMNTGESPYVNTDPMPENHASTTDQEESIEHPLV